MSNIFIFEMLLGFTNVLTASLVTTILRDIRTIIIVPPLSPVSCHISSTYIHTTLQNEIGRAIADSDFTFSPRMNPF
ncbi:hypothetical protein J3R30DRAFT_3428156 [Lentinula aciculospora]|uniref:Uncharacterized protein n=1 Tax=Lentinula aciculospora TaxID=153920 RepID=A0A9W9AVT4_9AGAR|nr:hypothetical protein J3R30DRAFT_3428156 [Lentinula aciculospora]